MNKRHQFTRRSFLKTSIASFTTLTILPLHAALDLATHWPGLEALFVRGAQTYATEGFWGHLHAA